MKTSNLLIHVYIQDKYRALKKCKQVCPALTKPSAFDKKNLTQENIDEPKEKGIGWIAPTFGWFPYAYTVWELDESVLLSTFVPIISPVTLCIE